MLIRYYCYWSALTGFGRAARDYVAAISQTTSPAGGLELEVVDWASIPRNGGPVEGIGKAPDLEPRYRKLDELVGDWPQGWKDHQAADVTIFHGQPALLASDQVRELAKLQRCPVAMTTWELDRMPAELAGALSAAYRATIVPSLYCRNVFERSGAPRPVVVPHTFDPAFWPFRPDPHPRDLPLRFYSAGAWSERKNHQAVIQAYLHTFDVQDDVVLEIHAAGADYEEIHALLARSGLPRHALPELRVHDRQLTEAEVLAEHALGVFVTATRGEGWGLPVFEAAISGRAIISPLTSGLADYLGDLGPEEAGYTAHRYVGSRRTPYFAGAPRANGTASRVAGADARMTWGDPSVCSLGNAMGAIYDTWKVVAGGCPVAAPGDRAALEQRFGYATVGPQLLATLKEIASE